MDQQYDVSPQMKRLFEIKQKQRAEAKEYFQKLLHNPYRPIDDGYPFDPALMRYNALNTYRLDLYEKTPKFFFKSFLCLTPFLITYYLFKGHCEKKEQYFRSGVVKYEDRKHPVKYFT